jgi:hypothetical protein
MTLAWICYGYDEEEPVILFDEPERYMDYARVIPIVFARVIPIVFAELKEKK